MFSIWTAMYAWRYRQIELVLGKSFDANTIDINDPA